jgi:hypothetical protein
VSSFISAKRCGCWKFGFWKKELSSAVISKKKNRGKKAKESKKREKGKKGKERIPLGTMPELIDPAAVDRPAVRWHLPYFLVVDFLASDLFSSPDPHQQRQQNPTHQQHLSLSFPNSTSLTEVSRSYIL